MTPEAPEALSWGQIAAYVGIFIGSILAFLFGERKKREAAVRSTATHDPANVLLTAGSIADMTPVRELTAQVKRLADAQAETAADTKTIAKLHERLIDLGEEWLNEDRARYIRELERLARRD